MVIDIFEGKFDFTEKIFAVSYIVTIVIPRETISFRPAVLVPVILERV